MLKFRKRLLTGVVMSLLIMVAKPSQGMDPYQQMLQDLETARQTGHTEERQMLMPQIVAAQKAKTDLEQQIARMQTDHATSVQSMKSEWESAQKKLAAEQSVRVALEQAKADLQQRFEAEREEHGAALLEMKEQLARVQVDQAAVLLAMKEENEGLKKEHAAALEEAKKAGLLRELAMAEESYLALEKAKAEIQRLEADNVVLLAVKQEKENLDVMVAEHERTLRRIKDTLQTELAVAQSAHATALEQAKAELQKQFEAERAGHVKVLLRVQAENERLKILVQQEWVTDMRR